MLNTSKIKQIRIDNNKNQSEVAELLNVSRSSYTMWESNNETIPIKRLILFCDTFNKSLDYAFDFTDQDNYQNSKKDINISLMIIRLKDLRKEHKLTQIKLAKILNIGNGTLADYERGRYIIATHALYTICKKYNISADYLLGKIDNPKYLNNQKTTLK